MIRIKKKDKWLTFSIFFYSLFVFLPLTRTLPTFAKMMLIGISMFFFLLNDCKNINRLFKDLLFVAGLVIADILIYQGVWKMNGVEPFSKNMMLFVFWIPILYVYSIKSYDSESKAMITALCLALVHIECLTTIIGNIRFPYASRQLASALDVEQNRIYQGLNIGGYGFIYALVFLLPYCFYRYKICREKKFLFSILLMEATILSSAYMTAILFSGVIIVLCLVLNSRIRRQIIGVILFIALLIFLFRMQVGELLNSVYLYLLNNNQHILAERIKNISVVFLTGMMTGDAGYRNTLSGYSWEAFFKSPLLGNLLNNSPNQLGLHSEFSDWLGGMGLIGVTVVISVLWLRCKNWYTQLRQKSCFPYLCISIIAVLVFLFINTVTAAPEIATIFFVVYTCMPNDEELFKDKTTGC